MKLTYKIIYNSFYSLATVRNDADYRVCQSLLVFNRDNGNCLSKKISGSFFYIVINSGISEFEDHK